MKLLLAFFEPMEISALAQIGDVIRRAHPDAKLLTSGHPECIRVGALYAIGVKETAE